MKPLRVRYARIERVVSSLLETFDVTGPPVPIGRIVKGSGIVVQSGDLGEVSGLLARSGTQTTIGVNSTHPQTRQRFTIAHEFGHFILHDGMISHVDKEYRVNFRSAESSEGKNIEEMEGEFFCRDNFDAEKVLRRRRVEESPRQR